MSTPSLQEIKDVLDDPAGDTMSDGAFWSWVGEHFDMESWEIIEIVYDNAEFFGWSEARPTDSGADYER